MGILGGENHYINKEQIHFQQFLAKMAAGKEGSKNTKVTTSKMSSTLMDKSIKHEEFVTVAQPVLIEVHPQPDSQSLNNSQEDVAEERHEDPIIVEDEEDDAISDLLNPILYVRGVPSDAFYLILQGSVVVCSGQEGFMVELGPFQFLGTQALAQVAPYLPDFSAKVINKARLLRIRRRLYTRILAA